MLFGVPKESKRDAGPGTELEVIAALTVQMREPESSLFRDTLPTARLGHSAAINHEAADDRATSHVLARLGVAAKEMDAGPSTVFRGDFPTVDADIAA